MSERTCFDTLDTLDIYSQTSYTDQSVCEEKYNIHLVSV